jgi:hypothetical protein
MIDDIRTRALDPMIQSAVGIVRESAGLLYHIAGFGIALMSSPQNSRPKYSTARTLPVAPEAGHRPTFKREWIMIIAADVTARTVDMLRLATAAA